MVKCGRKIEDELFPPKVIRRHEALIKDLERKASFTWHPADRFYRLVEKPAEKNCGVRLEKVNHGRFTLISSCEIGLEEHEGSGA